MLIEHAGYGRNTTPPPQSKRCPHRCSQLPLAASKLAAGILISKSSSKKTKQLRLLGLLSGASRRASLALAQEQAIETGLLTSVHCFSVELGLVRLFSWLGHCLKTPALVCSPCCRRLWRRLIRVLSVEVVDHILRSFKLSIVRVIPGEILVKSFLLDPVFQSAAYTLGIQDIADYPFITIGCNYWVWLRVPLPRQRVSPSLSQSIGVEDVVLPHC